MTKIINDRELIKNEISKHQNIKNFQILYGGSVKKENSAEILAIKFSVLSARSSSPIRFLKSIFSALSIIVEMNQLSISRIFDNSSAN